MGVDRRTKPYRGYVETGLKVNLKTNERRCEGGTEKKSKSEPGLDSLERGGEGSRKQSYIELRKKRSNEGEKSAKKPTSEGKKKRKQNEKRKRNEKEKIRSGLRLTWERSAGEGKGVEDKAIWR